MKRKILGILLSLTMVCSLLAGCGQGKDKAQTEGAKTESGENAKTGEETGDMGPMGRYLQEDEALPQQSKASGKLLRTAEGLWLFELDHSENSWFLANGATDWEQRAVPEQISTAYSSGYAASDTGVRTFACYEQKEDTSLYEYVIRTVNPDGSMPEPLYYNSALSVGDLTYGKDGKLYALIGGALHRLDPQTGEDENLLQVSTVAERLTILGDRLLIVDEGRVWIYNLSTDSVEQEDPVLNDFMKENITAMGAMDGNIYQACTFAGEAEDVIYLACKKGLFRHALYGSVMEQVIDGNLSSFGDPSRYIQGAEVVEEEDGSLSFLVLFYGSRLEKFTYHKEVPTVPEHQLKVYSLQESAALRQMIALFQQKNPDCYVTYEVGAAGNGGADTMELLKKLNTELMAGEGPDVLILDGLDQDTYQSKGLLMDLTALIKGLPEKEELLPQVVKAATGKDGIYSIPAGFSLPMVVGDKKILKHLKTTEDLPKVTKELREKYPEGVIWGSSVPECILAMVGEMEGYDWLFGGSLQEDSLRQAIQAAAELYQIELSGVTPELSAEEKSTEAEMYPGADAGSIALSSHYHFHSATVSLLLKQQKAALGYVWTPLDLCWVDQLPEELSLKPLEDGEGIGFRPCLQLAIHSGTKEQEKAEALVQLILSTEGQRLHNTEWTPVNQAAFEETLEKPQELNLGLSGMDAEGQMIELQAEWPTEKTLKVYRSAVKKMNHMLTGNQYLLDVVIQTGGQDLKKEKETEDILDDIKKKTAIYLAE